MAQINLTPKRISAMPPMEDPSVLEPTEAAMNWGMAVDSLCRSNAADRPAGSGLHEGEDQGTLYVPMNRIALRDSNGKIPASMLPGQLDDMIFGTLTVSSGKAVFDENPPPGSSTHYKYAAPTRDPDAGELVPPQNAVFCDTSNDIQYRFTGDSNVNDNITHYGFTVIPGSRAINTGYGLNIATSGTAYTLSANKPKYYIGSGSTTVIISDTAVGLGTVASSEYDTITLNSETTKFTLGALTSNNERVSYHAEIVLACIPTTQDAYITKISVNTGATILASCDYDMSSNASANDEDTVSLAFDFTTTAATKDFTIVGEASHSVTAKLTRISVTELI